MANRPITLGCEELVARIIRWEIPAISSIVIEGADQTENLPHPVYVSVSVPDDGSVEPILPNGPIYNVSVDVIRMAYYNHGTHAERKAAVAALHSVFQKCPSSWAMGNAVEGLLLKGWYIESIGQDDIGDYVGDGMRIVCAIQHSG